MSDFILEMNHITKEFSGVKALDDVNFKVKRNEIHGICGENGAGKSTLMNVLSGLYPYGTYSGDIMYDGEECKFHNLNSSEKKGIVIIHQELALSPNLSVAENVFIGNEVTSGKGIMNWSETHRKAKEILDKVGLKGENLDAPVSSLGVGKQQLIEIARALAKKVNLLILDEPTAALNDDESKNLLNIILQLKKEGITCILITHKIGEINYVADSITIIRDGKAIETLKKGKDDIDEDRIIKGMVGRELTNRYPDRDCKIGDVIFEVKNWNVHHPNDTERQVIKDASFKVRAGEVIGFAGLMGAGRTELAMSLFGKSYGSRISGEVLLHEKPVSFKNVEDAINHKVAYLSENRKEYGLIVDDNIKQNMTIAALQNFFSRQGVVNHNEEIVAAERYRRITNLKTNSIEDSVASLSGGNQQKVAVAKWMLTEPDVLLLDEPTRGIDVGAKYEIYCTINDLASEGKAIIVISSEMQELIGTCDRIYIIAQGQIVGELSKEEVSQEKIMKLIIAHSKSGKEYN